MYLGEGAANRRDFYPLPAVLYNHINIHLTCLHSYSHKRSKVCVPGNLSHHHQEDSSQTSFLHGYVCPGLQSLRASTQVQLPARAPMAKPAAEARQQVLAGSLPHEGTAVTAPQHRSLKLKCGPTLLGQAGARLRRVLHTTRQRAFWLIKQQAPKGNLKNAPG